VREHLKRGGKDRVLSDDEIATLWEALDSLAADATRKKLPPVRCPPTGRRHGGETAGLSGPPCPRPR
jgi:hypothetical protein